MYHDNETPGDASRSGPDTVTPNHAPDPQGSDAVAVMEAPPERVGLLLADTRTRRGLRFADVADRLGGRLSPGEIMALESGALTPEPALLADLCHIYDVSPSDLVPPRDHLVVDRAEGYMRAGQDMVLLDGGVGHHDLLSRYLEMIWELRAVEPGSRVPLRDADLDVLGESLGTEPQKVRRDLMAIMTGFIIDRASGAPKRRVLVGLGVAIAVVTGGLFISHGAGGAVGGPPAAAAAETRLPPNPTVTIGEALVLERGGSQRSAAAREPVAPTAEIGTAAVQERNPDGSPGPQQTR